MSGFKTREPIRLFLPRSLVESSREEQSPATSSEGGQWKSPRQGRDQIQRRRNPSQVWWTTDKTPFPDGRSRKERVCGLLQCARHDQTEHDVVAKIQTSRSQEDQEGFPLFKIPVPGEMWGQMLYGPYRQKRWRGETVDEAKTIFNT
jgi:hypothetical protein